MGDYKKNPRQPVEVQVPNKIRKRIVMHETEGSFLKRAKAISELKKLLTLPTVPVAKKRGSLYLRFSNRIKNFLGG